jgi:prepilin-type N-terminal cleavage/methylation domain-containing protein
MFESPKSVIRVTRENVMHRQHGFTLVEIAIVLLIIGLLLGGVLKGQEMITQAKIRNVANDLNGIAAAAYAYQDRYKKLPGDDDAADNRWTNPATKKGDGNGALGAATAGVIDCTLPANVDGENCRFWQHLRLAGLISGDASSATAPQNAGGGIIQAQNGALGLSGLVVCATGLSGKLADAIDAQMDDGKPGMGQVRATDDSTKLNAKLADNASYKDDGATVYTLCKSI